MPVSPTRAESVEAMQVASDEFRTQLFSESGIAWYRKQADDCREKVAHFLHVKLGEGGHPLVFIVTVIRAFHCQAIEQMCLEAFSCV